MHIQHAAPLAPLTSFQLGGDAQYFVEVHNSNELVTLLEKTDKQPIWLLGYGSNTLISDKGLDGLVINMQGGEISVSGTTITVDGGVWWDDVVKTAIGHKLWGIELMSEIPGSVGAALYINITAYGQSIGAVVEWVEVWDPSRQEVVRMSRSDLTWGYKQSLFQKEENKHLIITRTRLALSETQTEELVYQKAVDVAAELDLDQDDIEQRRDIIIEARNRAGSLWKPGSTNQANTVGSFFRNPVVTEEQAHSIMEYDETGKTRSEIQKMNQVHGGDTRRVSAAHVMLAGGFSRGQQWGNVKLNDQNLLKIEALPGATAQEVYDVARTIQKTCKEKVGVQLEPEARILGQFD